MTICEKCGEDGFLGYEIKGHTLCFGCYLNMKEEIEKEEMDLKVKKEIEEKGAWTIVKKFIGKYHDNVPNSELGKLKSLLKNKYDIKIDTNNLKLVLTFAIREVDDEKRKREFEIFKKVILSESPKTKEYFINALLKHYGDNYHQKIDLLIKLLKEKGIELDISKLDKIVQDAKRIKELESFEEGLMAIKKPSVEHEARLAQIKKKIKKWKDDGYNVDELEGKLKFIKE